VEQVSILHTHLYFGRKSFRTKFLAPIISKIYCESFIKLVSDYDGQRCGFFSTKKPLNQFRQSCKWPFFSFIHKIRVQIYS
jgi:hypothetical protein